MPVQPRCVRSGSPKGTKSCCARAVCTQDCTAGSGYTLQVSGNLVGHGQRIALQAHDDWRKVGAGDVESAKKQRAAMRCQQ